MENQLYRCALSPSEMKFDVWASLELNEMCIQRERKNKGEDREKKTFLINKQICSGAHQCQKQ